MAVGGRELVLLEEEQVENMASGTAKLQRKVALWSQLMMKNQLYLVKKSRLCTERIIPSPSS